MTLTPVETDSDVMEPVKPAQFIGFMAIPGRLSTEIIFAAKENIGKWLSIGFFVSVAYYAVFCHEWYTIFDGGFMGNLQNKIEYFSETMQWLVIEGKYIPDIYHTVLHMLILLTLICTVIYTIKIRRI